MISSLISDIGLSLIELKSTGEWHCRFNCIFKVIIRFSAFSLREWINVFFCFIFSDPLVLLTFSVCGNPACPLFTSTLPLDQKTKTNKRWPEKPSQHQYNKQVIFSKPCTKKLLFHWTSRKSRSLVPPSVRSGKCTWHLGHLLWVRI